MWSLICWLFVADWGCVQNGYLVVFLEILKSAFGCKLDSECNGGVFKSVASLGSKLSCVIQALYFFTSLINQKLLTSVQRRRCSCSWEEKKKNGSPIDEKWFFFQGWGIWADFESFVGIGQNGYWEYLGIFHISGLSQFFFFSLIFFLWELPIRKSTDWTEMPLFSLFFRSLLST